MYSPPSILSIFKYKANFLNGNFLFLSNKKIQYRVCTAVGYINFKSSNLTQIKCRRKERDNVEVLKNDIVIDESTILRCKNIKFKSCNKLEKFMKAYKIETITYKSNHLFIELEDDYILNLPLSEEVEYHVPTFYPIWAVFTIRCDNEGYTVYEILAVCNDINLAIEIISNDVKQLNTDEGGVSCVNEDIMNKYNNYTYLGKRSEAPGNSRTFNSGYVIEQIVINRKI